MSLRGALAPLLLGIVSKPVQVGFFRIAQAPQQGLASLSAPARLIMLTEQTRDWARGATAAVFAGVKQYASWAALLMAVLVPPAYILMPWLVRVLYGEDYEGASEAARLVLLAAALQFVFGWSKSLPVSIGRPGLRVLAHGVESVVMIPLVVVLGREWGATGAAGAVLASTVVFCLIWVVLLAQIRRRSRREGPDRHRHLAAGRRRPREPCAGARRAPAVERPRGGGRDDRGRVRLRPSATAWTGSREGCRSRARSWP